MIFSASSFLELNWTQPPTSLLSLCLSTQPSRHLIQGAAISVRASMVSAIFWPCSSRFKVKCALWLAWSTVELIAAHCVRDLNHWAKKRRGRGLWKQWPTPTSDTSSPVALQLSQATRFQVQTIPRLLANENTATKAPCQAASAPETVVT